MKRDDLKSFYSDRRSAFSGSFHEVKKKINVVSNLRLLVAAAILVTFYFGLTNNTSLFYVTLLEVVVFIFLMRHHSSLFRKKTHLENLLNIQSNELAALQGNFSQFDEGRQFIDPHHPYTHDLDVFGDGSLFQMINRCNTPAGKAMLASRLSAPALEEGLIRQTQESVKELEALPEYCHEIQASGMEIGETANDRQQLLSWLTDKPFIFGNKILSVLLTALPIITIVLLFATIFFDGFSKFFWFCAAIQWAILGVNLRKINEFHESIGKRKNTLEKYADLLTVIEKQQFATLLLKSLRERAHTAHEKVTQLASLSKTFDARANSMMNLLVNSTIMFDLQCVHRLEKWKAENANSLEEWLNVVTEMEVLVSLGTFTFNNDDLVFPSLNSNQILKAEGLGHPMIAVDERVVNDISIDNNGSILIITGANMAGKSTFLRSLGVNVVLTLAGAPVCAKSFDCPLIAIRSGMRTADSLKDHQSYFYAELNRLKSMVDELKTGKPLLILLDEILKGTNSTDKQTGSIALVKQLLDQPALVLIATHDLVLGELEHQHPDKVRNYCFEPSIIDDQLSFDYKLKRGIAQKMNATFLMKKMGIIPK